MPKMYPGYREEIEKKIVAQASALFMEKGFSATKMDDIAARLGVTKASIYQYYKSKADLFAAVAEFQRQELAGILERSFEGQEMMEGASLLFDSLLAYINKSMEMYHDVMAVAVHNEALRAILLEDRNGDLAVIGQFIEAQKEKGLIHPSVNSRVLAVACDALVNGLMFDVMLGMDPAEAKGVWLDAVDDLVRVHE
ncbi:MAG: TetR/AcrR family transcriptional regulator [Methanoregula sp.]|nr:MAG: TetR/AcrR family transcriptional regulator [Methanoregula sp.]